MDMDVADDNIKFPSKWELSSNQSSASNVKSDSRQSEWHSPSTSSPITVNTPSSGKKVKGKSLFSFTLLQCHVVSKAKGKIYKCDVCASSYRHAFSLKRHFLRNHVTVKYISQSDINNCKINVNKKGIIDEPIDYDSDDKSSDSSSSGQDKTANEITCPNEDSVKMIGLYRCHLCKGLRFDSREEICSHFQMHLNSSKMQYPCEKCNIVFSHKQALYRHLASHSESTTFPCTTCGKTFENKTLYLKHTMTHTDGRTCKYCKKVLSTKANKCRHERIHEGLKPYPCKHCNTQFTQSGDLKKHVKKQHKALYVTCPICSNLFSCKSALNKHIADKHIGLSQENLVNNAVKENNTIPSEQKVSSNVHPPQAGKMSKYHQCSVCKKRYHSYLSMLHHKRRCHPSPSAHRVHKKIRYYTRRQSLFHKHSNSEVPEEEFYKSLSSMISDNLLNHVDGKPSQLSLRQYNFSEPFEQLPSVASHQWAMYNFPSSFDVEQALQVKGEEVRSASSESNSSDSIVNGLDYSRKNVNGMDYDSSSDCDNSDYDASPFSCRMYMDYKNINIEERKKLIGRVTKSVILCSVCRECLPSHQAFLEHSSNNHPNVLSSYVEIESEKDSPPVIPQDLQHQFLSPVGVYFSCSVPPPANERALMKCTKCQLMFTSAPDLHQHIVLCGGSDNASQPHVRKIIMARKIKRTMKKRFSAPYLERRSSQRLPSESPGKDTSVFKSGVGRPRNNSFVLCPHCKQNFRTKALLNNHMNRCYKKVGMKNRYLQMTLRKVDAPSEPLHPAAETPKNDFSQQEKKNACPTEADHTPTPPRVYSPVERLSPSLEVLVNSIKEKLTADELSPSIPTFSWMEDPFVLNPSTSPLATVSEGKGETSSSLTMPISTSPEKINEDKKCNADVAPLDATEATVEAEVDFVLGSDKPSSAAEVDVAFPCVNKVPSLDQEDVISVKNRSSPKPMDIKKKPGTPKYKPKVNPYVKKRRKKRAKLAKVEVAFISPPQSPAPQDGVMPKNLPNQIEESGVLSEQKVPATGSSTELVVPVDCPPITKVNINSTPDVTASTSSVEACEPAKVIFARNKVQKRSTSSRNDSTKRLRCPFCMVDFAYVTTFHRHVNVCPEKKTKNELSAQEGSSPRLLLIPKKDEVEESMLNLLRHQSRQSKMMKEAKTDDSNDVKNFQTYTCDSCHKIFFSLFKLLQHRVVHKLQSNGEKNGSTFKDATDPKDTVSDPLAASGTTTLTVPGLAIASTRRSSMSRLSISQACSTTSIPASRLRGSLSTPPSALRLEIPKSSTNLSHSGPMSAPVRLETSTSTQSTHISKAMSIGFLPANAVTLPEILLHTTVSETPKLDNIASKDQKGPNSCDEKKSTTLIVEPNPEEAEVVDSPIDTSIDGFPKRKVDDVPLKSPFPKRRKKMKKLVVKKHDYLTKQQLLKRATKTAQSKTETDDSSQFVDSSESVIALPEVKDDIATNSSIVEESSVSTTTPASSPKRTTSKTKPPTPHFLANRTCVHCGKVFASTSYTNRHMLRHAQLATEMQVVFQPSPAKVKKTLKKKLLKRRKHKRDALQRLCKTRLSSQTNK